MRTHLLLAIGLVATPLAYADKDSVKLVYDWQPGIEARVDYAAELTRQGGGRDQKRSLTGHYDLTTVAHKQGLQLDFANVSATAGVGAGPAEDRIQRFVQQLAQLSPSYVVNEAGELVDVIGMEDIAVRMREEMEDWFKDVQPEMKGKLSQMLDQMVSPQQLRATVEQDWNRMVGQWVGGESTTGSKQEVRYETPVPFLNNRPLPTVGHYEYLGRTACHTQDEQQACVRVKFIAQVDTAALTAATAEAFQQMGQTYPEGVTLQMDYELEIVTEPGTLYPHSLRETKLVTVPAPEGKATQTDTKTFTFTYNKR